MTVSVNEVDFAVSALVTIDVQRDTLDGQPLEVPGTSQVRRGARCRVRIRGRGSVLPAR